ncbi:MAG: RluA family pseudouridine synthase [Actinomycetota bacterium]|nr:RluA family pseudouridine synthase [Actinomycetota bacterium]
MTGGRPSSDGALSAHEDIPDGLAGQRLDRVVSMITGLSRSEAAVLVADGSVLVDGAPCTRGALRLSAGASIDVAVPDGVTDVARPDPEVEVPIVHVDADLIVIDKPAGLVVHPGAGVQEGTLVNGLLAHFPDLAGVGDPTRPGIVHRLDKGTSGLMVVARTQDAYAALVHQLSVRSVNRRYLALLWGVPDSAQGLVDAPIGRSLRTPTRMVVSARGKEARTRYEVLESFTDPVVASLVECRLETGRTHQVRVHLAAIGHPVVGDDRYDGARQSLVCPRPFLHAATLGFVHPRSAEHCEFASPLPEDIGRVLADLRSARRQDERSS